MQRWAYYVAIPLALAVAVISPSSPSLARYGLVAAGAFWLGSMVFGVYHSGVEWSWWPGPTTCTGTGQLTGGLPDLSTPAVMCDEAAIRILGLSLAGLERGDLAGAGGCRGGWASALTDRVRYPSRDSPASSRAGSWAETGGHCGAAG